MQPGKVPASIVKLAKGSRTASLENQDTNEIFPYLYDSKSKKSVKRSLYMGSNGKDSAAAIAESTDHALQVEKELD